MNAMHSCSSALILASACLFQAACSTRSQSGLDATLPASGAEATTPTSIHLPDGDSGIGFDDLRYSQKLGRVLVPAGRTGKLDLIEPASGKIEVVSGFSA